jgi:hypothetical protein
MIYTLEYIKLWEALREIEDAHNRKELPCSCVGLLKIDTATCYRP